MRITRYSALAIAAGLLLVSSLLLVEGREYLTVKTPQPDLERIISEHPDGWKPLSGQSVDSEWSKSLQASYDLVTTRLYQHVNGNSVSVLMTWSQDGISRPGHLQQVCYQVSGSEISTPKYVTIATKAGKQDGIAFTARHGNQIEDVMYWRITGGKTDLSRDNVMFLLFSYRLDKLARLTRSLLGNMPDNLMVRVSSLRHTPDQPATAHLDYIREYLETLPANDRKLIMGR